MVRLTRRCLCLLLVCCVLLSCSMSVFAVDLYLSQSLVNYSSAIARTKAQCNNAYAYLSTVIHPKYVQKVYDLIYRAQYRLSLFGGDNWIYLNEGDSVSRVEDRVLGSLPIGLSKGCNAYARFAAQYIRGQQGTLLRAADYLHKPEDYVPSASEIQQFMAQYADVGERILTGYYHNVQKTIRPHSLVFLGEDAEHDGFYFLCQDGDGNGQTLRYFSYEYMATRLRYFEKYGYALAIGDTNNGRDIPNTQSIIGSVDSVSPMRQTFSSSEGFDLTAKGWAVAKDSSAVRICLYDGASLITTAVPTTRSDISALYPTWSAGNAVGFRLSADLSCLSTGYHDLHIVAQTSGVCETMQTIRIFVSNISFTLDDPKEEWILLSSDTSSLPLSGTFTDGSASPVPVSVRISQDNSVLAEQTLARKADSTGGFEDSVSVSALSPGEYSVEFFAVFPDSTLSICSLPLYITDALASVVPLRMTIQSLPKRTELRYGEEWSTDGLCASVLFSDGRVETHTNSLVCSAVDTKIPGTQTVDVCYGELCQKFTVRILPPTAPQSVTLSAADFFLAKGKTMPLIADCTPSDAAGYRIVWSSVHENIAKVDENGTVTGVSVGDTEIVATVFDYYGNEVCHNAFALKVRHTLTLRWIYFMERVLTFLGIQIRIS